MSVLVQAVDQPGLPPFRMSDRFRHEITYFMTIPGEQGAPQMPAGDYWIDKESARQWLDDGQISLVSPLDSENRAEVELSEEQEDWLQWMVDHGIERVRLVAGT
jgi:hypothetical protein